LFETRPEPVLATDRFSLKKKKLIGQQEHFFRTCTKTALF